MEEEAANNGSNLFITGLAPIVKEQDLQDLFSKYGAVERTQIMRDPHSGGSRGFGFVNFSNPEDAVSALELAGTEFMGRNLIVQVVLSTYSGKEKASSQPYSWSVSWPC